MHLTQRLEVGKVVVAVTNENGDLRDILLRRVLSGGYQAFETL